MLERFPLPSDNRFVNQFFNLLYGAKPEPGPLIDFVVDRIWETDQSVMAQRLAQLELFDVSDRLWRIDVPTLIVAGARDAIVPAARQRLGRGDHRCSISDGRECRTCRILDSSGGTRPLCPTPLTTGQGCGLRELDTGRELLVASWLYGLVDFSHRFDFVPLWVQGPPDEHHDSGCRRTGAVVEYFADLGDREPFLPSPIVARSARS